MDALKKFVPTAMKAVAMFVAPFILIIIGWLVDNIGISVARPELDETVTWLTGALVAVVNSVWVYFQRNHSAA